MLDPIEFTIWKQERRESKAAGGLVREGKVKAETVPLGLSARRRLLGHDVERRTGLEPLNLALVVAVLKRDLVNRAVLVLGNKSDGAVGRDLLDATQVNKVVGLDLVVVLGVNKGKREHTLLSEVGVVDTGERARDDGDTTKVSGLKSGVLSRRTLTVVLVTNHNPRASLVTVGNSRGGNSAPLASKNVLHLVGLAVGLVDGTNQTVVGDVLKVTTVLEPGTTSRDVVSGALALGLDKDRAVSVVLAVPRLEGLELLQTVRAGVDRNVDRGAVRRGSLVGVLTSVVAARRELLTGGGRELELLAVSALERVGQGVEGEATSESQGRDNVGRGNESVRRGVGVVTAGEVTVVGGDDRVLLALGDVLSVPLADARTTGVGKNNTTGLLEDLHLTVTLDGGTDLLRTGGDGEAGLDLEAVRGSLSGDRGGSAHVLVRRVGARTNERDLELLGPVVLLDGVSELGERGGKIGGEGTVDVGLKVVEVNLDVRVVLSASVGEEVLLEALGKISDLGSVGGTEVVTHALVVGEDGGGSTNLGTHVADGGHTSARERLDTRSLVLDDGTGTTLDGELTSNLEDNVLGRGPAVELALELDTNDLGALKLPGDVSHDVDSVGTTDTASNHAKTTGVGGVRVGTDHQTTGESVVLEDDLVDNTRTGLPEADAVLGSGSGKEVVDLLVDLDGTSKILGTADLSLDKVVTVDGGGDSNVGETSRHELKEGHLSGGILASNTLFGRKTEMRNTSTISVSTLSVSTKKRGPLTSGRSLRKDWPRVISWDSGWSRCP